MALSNCLQRLTYARHHATPAWAGQQLCACASRQPAPSPASMQPPHADSSRATVYAGAQPALVCPLRPFASALLRTWTLQAASTSRSTGGSGPAPDLTPSQSSSTFASTLASSGTDPTPAAASAETGASPSRQYPSHARVGIGAVVFRLSRDTPPQPQVLLIKRGKEPNKGCWSFPGGTLELGETMAECAEREVLEETGIRIRNAHEDGLKAWSSSLRFPTAFAAADCIERSHGEQRVRFHYCIVELAALASDPLQEPVAGDDAEEAVWMDVQKVQGLEGLTEGCDRIAHEATRIFDIKGLLEGAESRH